MNRQKGCVAIILALTPLSESPRSTHLIAKTHLWSSSIETCRIDPVYAKVMTDNYKAGQLAAQQMIEALEDRGAVAVLGLQQGISSTDAREQGFINTIRSSNIKLLPA